MHVTTTVNLQPFNRPYALALLDFICATLPEFGIETVDVLYGWAWSVHMPDYERKSLPLAELKADVAAVEAGGFGQIGEDDLILTVAAHDLEITLCHEADLHLQYSAVTPLVDKLVAYAVTVFNEIAASAQPFTSPVFFAGGPTYFVMAEVQADEGGPITIQLAPWGKTLHCTPQQQLRITCHSKQPGTMVVDQTGRMIVVTAWPGSQVRVHCDKQQLLDTDKLSQ